MSDVRIVNWQGDVIWDEAEDRRIREGLRDARQGEPFTASVDCPDCGQVDIHWLDAPRPRPEGDSPLARTQRRIAAMFDAFNSGATFDPPGIVVARICRGCGYRWGQR